jgi:hypothetical protein
MRVESRLASDELRIVRCAADSSASTIVRHAKRTVGERASGLSGLASCLMGR